MSDHVKVTFGEIAGAQSNISSASQHINAQLDDLRSFVERLAGQWEGEAREAYYVQQRKLETAAAELNQVLQQISIATGNANDAYQAAERANTSRFGG